MSTTNLEKQLCSICNHTHIFFFADDGKTELNHCENILDCSCQHFFPTLANSIDKDVRAVIENFDFYVKDLSTKKETIQYALDNLGFTRNFKNKDFVLFYWLIFDAKNDTVMRECIKYLIKHSVQLTETETIRRAKQEAVEEDSIRYGPTDDTLIKAKLDKEEEYYRYYSKND